jgi:hypothetical protein
MACVLSPTLFYSVPPSLVSLVKFLQFAIQCQQDCAAVAKLHRYHGGSAEYSPMVSLILEKLLTGLGRYVPYSKRKISRHSQDSNDTSTDPISYQYYTDFEKAVFSISNSNFGNIIMTFLLVTLILT